MILVISFYQAHFGRPAPSPCIWVGGLPPDIHQDWLHSQFEMYGEILRLGLNQETRETIILYQMEESAIQAFNRAYYDIDMSGVSWREVTDADDVIGTVRCVCYEVVAFKSKGFKWSLITLCEMVATTNISDMDKHIIHKHISSLTWSFVFYLDLSRFSFSLIRISWSPNHCLNPSPHLHPSLLIFMS